MANINPITGKVEEEKSTTPAVEFVYEPEVEFVYEPEPSVMDRIGAGLGRAAAAVVPDVIGTAAERAAETVIGKMSDVEEQAFQGMVKATPSMGASRRFDLAQGGAKAGEEFSKYASKVYDWAQEPPQIVKDSIKKAEQSLMEAPAGSSEERLAQVELFLNSLAEPFTTPLGIATLAGGPATSVVGKVAPELLWVARTARTAVDTAAAMPAAEQVGKLAAEITEKDKVTAGDVGELAGNVLLATVGGVGAVQSARGIAPAYRSRNVITDKQWDSIKDRVRATQAADEATPAPAGLLTDAEYSEAARAARAPLALPPSPEAPPQAIQIEGQTPLALPAAPAVEEFIQTVLPSGKPIRMPGVIPTGETIRVPEVPTEAQVSTARELAKTKAFNEKVKRITNTFLEDGIKLNRKQAAEMARITDPREYSLTRQAILDANRPLEAGAVENPPAKTRTPLKGFEELTPEMVGVRPEEPVVPKKTGVVAGEVPVLEGPAKAPEGLGEAPLPTTPRMLELERPMYDSGLVDAQGNTVWVDEQGRTIDRRTYEDPRERVRTPEEQAIYDRQLAERVEFDKRAEAAEQVDKIAAGDEVMVSLPDAPAPVPAAFVGKNPQNPSTSRVMTPQGELAVPNTAIESAKKAEVDLAKTPPTITARRPKLVIDTPATPGAPVVTKVKDITVGGWDVQLGANKYRIFRDPEDRWWYLDAPGHHSRNVLSTGTKADAIKFLSENEPAIRQRVAAEKATIKRLGEEAKKRTSRTEQWADETIKSRRGRVSSNPFLDPEWVAANAVKGAIIMGRGATTFARWSKEMIKELGENIRPNLRKLWKYMHNEDVPGILAGRRKIKPTTKITPEQLIQRAVGDAAENRRLFLAMREDTGVAKNPEVTFTTKPDAEGKTKPITVGATTSDKGKSYDAWMEETRAWMSPKEIADARLWYREANQMFRDIYGGDMPRELLLWLMSQQNVSPSGGIGNISHVKDMLANIGLGKKGGLAHKKLMAVLSGEITEGTAAGLSRKLLDFVDSGQLKNTRTFHGDDPEMGQPAVADVWSGRDSGHVDHQTLSRLYDMAESGNLYLDGEPVKLEVSEFKTIRENGERRRVPLEMTYKTPSMPEPVALEIDLTSSPSGTQYEGVSKWMNEGARRMNLANFAGINDWTPIEFQAVGWMRTLKQYGRAGQTVQEAFESNIRRIPAEVNYNSGSILPFEFPAWGDLDPVAQRKITTDVLGKLIPKLVDVIGGSLKLVNISEGQGRFAGEVSSMTAIEVIGSDAATTILRDAAAYVSDQKTTMSWRSIVGGENKRAVVIKRADGQKLSEADLTRLTGEAKLVGYSVMRSPGDGNMILITDADRKFTPRSFTAEKADQLTTRLKEWAANNPDLPLDVANVPSTIKSSTNDWNKTPNGDVYLQNIVGAGGSTRISQFVDLRNRYARDYLEPAFAEHSPELLEQFRAERADAKGRWLPDAVAQRDFRDAIAAAAKKHPFGKAVTVKTAEEYAQRGFKFFLAPDKSAGVAVAPDGDLVSVFKAVGSKVNIDPLLEQAAKRAIKLDAYASGDGFLINKYGQFGFRPVAKMAFNREFAPKGWVYGRMGTPDIVFMVRDPEGVTGAPEVKKNYAKIQNQIPLLSMDEAVKKQMEAADQVRTFNATSQKQRGAINMSMLSYMGQSAIGATGGYYYGYNKDPNAPLEEKVMNGLMWGIMGLGAGNPTIRNAVLNGVYKAKIPVKYFGPQIKRAVGGMDNFVIFTKSVLGEVYDVIKSEAPLAESLKNKAATALDTLESMRAKADPNDWYGVGQSMSNHGNPNNILKPKLREATMVVRSSIDDFTTYLIGTNLVRPGSDLEFTMLINRGTYLTRTYEIFTNPDFQYDPVKQQRAIAEYVAQLRLNGDTRPTGVIQQEGLELTLFQLAKTQGTALAPNARSFALGKGIARVDGSILKPRKELSDAWREMMGEITDPVHAATLTIDRMADIIAAEKTQQAMADVGLRTGLFSRQATSTHNVPLINIDGNNVYGPLNKLWTTRDVADGLQTMRAYRSHSLLFRSMAFIQGNIKIGKTVLHPVSYAPNFISALMQPLVQGHYIQMVFNPRNYRDAFSIVFDSPFPSNMAQVEADLPMLIKHGLLRQSVNLNDLLETARASGATALGSRMVTWFPKAAEIPKKVMGGALSVYGKAEEFPRIIGFYAEAGRYAKAFFGKDLNQLSPNERAIVYERAITVSKEVYPNSQNVPEVVKKLSVTGFLEPFVAFKYEIFRTTYATARRAVMEIKEGVETKNPRLTSSAVARLSALIGVLYGAYGINEAFNETKGVSGEQDKAFRRRLADWDQTGLLIVTDFNPEEIAYANQSYILPQSVPAAAFKAALEGKTPMDASAIFYKETIGTMTSDGGLLVKPVFEALQGRTLTGREIYPRDGGTYIDISGIETRETREAAQSSQNAIVGTSHILKTIAPGFVTESMKWYKAAKEEVGPDGQVYQVGDLLQRLAGVRVQRIIPSVQFERHAGELFTRINKAATAFGELRNKRDATPEMIEDGYQMMEQSRKIVFRDLVEHIRDGELLKQPKEQIISQLREKGIPSDMLIGALNGFYVPGKKEKGVSARDRFEAMMNKPEGERLAMWSQIQATEPMLAKAFRPLFQEMAQGRTQEERMLLSLDDNDGTRARIIAQIILKQPTQMAQQIKYQELLQRGMIKGQTANQLYGDPVQSPKIWAESAIMLKNGSNPAYFPQVTSDITPPTNPGATMRRPQAAPAPTPQPVEPTRTPAPSSKFREGQYYRDKTTGQVMQYVNGQFLFVQP